MVTMTADSLPSQQQQQQPQQAVVTQQHKQATITTPSQLLKSHHHLLNGGADTPPLLPAKKRDPIASLGTTAIGISRRLNNLIAKTTTNLNNVRVIRTNSVDNNSYHSSLPQQENSISDNNNYTADKNQSSVISTSRTNPQIDSGSRTSPQIDSGSRTNPQTHNQSSITRGGMSLDYAPCHRVHSRLTLYYGSLIDLQWARSVHSCDDCSSSYHDTTSSSQYYSQYENTHNRQGVVCKAVHFGQCTAYKGGGGGVFVNRQQRLGTGTGPSTPQPQHNANINAPTTPQSSPQRQFSPQRQISPQKVVPSAPPPKAPLPQSLPQPVRVITTQNVKLNLQKDRTTEGASNHQQSQLPNNKDSLPKRGDPDGQPDPFLRQKEAELREKREREKGSKKEPRETNNTWTGSHGNPGGKDTNGANNLSNNLATINTNSNQGGVASDDTAVINVSAKGSKSQPHIHRLRTNTSGKTPAQGSQSEPTVQTGSAQSATALHKQQVLYRNVHIPQFYFPKGQSVGGPVSDGEVILGKIKEEFAKVEGGRATKANMKPIVKVCGLPMYMSTVVFKAFGGEKHGHLTLQQYLAQWRKLCGSHHDNACKFVHLIGKPGCAHLIHDDFVPLIQDVVEGHPGLTFLQEAPEFHSRYVQTVISRIFYCVNRSWTGRITVNEIRRSNLIQTLKLLDEEEDINQITDYFSYEHFYVIYCKFWELDKDHDLYISKDDLARHNDHAISSKMIDRIFSGAVTKNLKEGKMSYKDFVWFLISEEDKRHHTSVEYWFRCMDLDGDGVISMYEMEYFYKEQVDKMEQLGIETLPFEDTLCQMLDMLKPRVTYNISLRDLKACKLTPIFFDTFFNLDKYLEHEQKDPFANARDLEDGEPEPSDWERYAAEEYELLVAEEGANENMDELVYEDDFEAEEEDVPTIQQQQEVLKMGDNTTQNKQNNDKKQGRPKAPSPDEDIYDFSNKDLGY